jgi:D-alanyl-D-alanine dipeptidase
VNHPRARSLLFFSALCLFASGPTVRAQTKAPGNAAIVPGPRPVDVPAEWKQLVGVYRLEGAKEPVIVLERNRHLYLRRSSEDEQEIVEQDGFLFLEGVDGRRYGYKLWSDAERIQHFSHWNEVYSRDDAGSDPTHFYHLVPSLPVDQLRAAALALKPPTESGSFRNPELVEVATLDPAFHLDIRYAHSNNFLSTPMYTQARAFLQKPAAEALLRVLRKLEPLGYGLLLHDAYRPWYVTKIFWDATPPEGHNFVADPQKGSRHNRGCAVDLTLYDLATGQPIQMPGLYDEMSPRSFPTFPGGTSLQRWHRDLLRRAMENEGFSVNEDEWWHYDYKDWKLYPILNVPFEDLHNQSSHR